MIQDTDALFALVNSPGLHIVHVVAPGLWLIQPFGHTEHASLPMFLNVPGMHFEQETEPFAFVNSPAVHIAHAVAPECLLIQPFGHAEHDSLPFFLNVPGMHLVHLALPASDVSPVPQCSQSMAVEPGLLVFC